MTWDNGGILPRTTLPWMFPLSRLRRTFPRLYRRTAPQPWVWERLATFEEIAQLRKTDLRRAA